MKKAKQVQCKHCGYSWKARVEKPKACPECKRRDWNTSQKGEQK